MGNILVINGGSSSIKFKLFTNEIQEICSGICERIFVDGNFKITYFVDGEKKEFESAEDFKNHDIAIEYMLAKLVDLGIIESIDEISGIGHRVVQGASDITESVIIDDKVEKIIERNIDLAPLHNKPELDIIRIMKSKLPNVKNVGVFDSSFHTTIPEIHSTYAIPKHWREDLKVKRYGAHGTSYRYILERMKGILNKESLNLIVCHLGNGSSICAIKNSKSINNSMGLTPLEGLIMGTRSGDVDPSVFKYISSKLNIDSFEIDRILNNESGVKGLCGFSDFRDITSRSEPGNIYDFTLNLFSKRVAEYIIKYTNDLENKVDALVFCGGVGENDGEVRRRIINFLHMGNYNLDPATKDARTSDYIQINKELCEHSKKIFIVRTNEEIMIAKDVKKLI